MKVKTLLVAFAFLLTSTTGAYAGTIDLSGYTFGVQGSTTLVTPEGTFSTPDGADLYIYNGLGDDYICALNLSSFSCEADLELVFNGVAFNLSFTTTGWNPGDTAEAFVYDGDDNLLSSVVIASDTTVDLSAYAGIVRLFIDDSSTGAGFGYGNFTFDLRQIATVPEPSILGIFGFGLLGLGMFRRKKFRS